MQQVDKLPKKKRGFSEEIAGKLGLMLPPSSIGPFKGSGGVATKSIEMWDRYISHPGAGIDPREIINIYRCAELGDPMRQVDLFADTIETDGHLRSAIEDRLLAVAGKEWEVMAGGDAPIDIMAAEILRDQLAESNFDDCIAAILASRYHGFSGTEIDWRRVDSDIVPSWFVPVPFRRFKFDSRGRPMLMNSELYEGKLLKPGHWVWGTNASLMTGNHARSGLMRSAVFFSLFKKWSWRDWVIYAEKFGIPLVLGKHDPDASEEEKEVLEEVVQDVGDAGQATMSKNLEVEIREAQQGGDSTGLHRAIVMEANNEISRLITGATLTGNSGSSGSYALAEVHQQRAFNLVLADARMVSDRFKRDIAKPWAIFNGLQKAKLPVLKIHVAKEINPKVRAEILQILQAMGLDIDAEQVRQEFQLRSPPSDARSLKAKETPPPTNEKEAA